MHAERKRQLYVVMAHLLYPAILGAIIYDVFKLFFFDKLENGTDLTPQFIFLVFAFVLLYVVDYSYTFMEKQNDYSLIKFFCDLVIVVSLFFALKLILGEIDHSPATYRSFNERFPNNWRGFASPIFWLFVTKLFSVFWEVHASGNICNWLSCGFSKKALHLYFCGSDDSVKRLVFSDKKSLRKFFEVASDAAFVIVYGSFLWVEYTNANSSWLDGTHPNLVCFVALLLLLDAFTYWWHAKLGDKLT